MSRRLSLSFGWCAVLLFCLSTPANAALPLDCQPSATRHAEWVTGRTDPETGDWFTRLLRTDQPMPGGTAEIYGNHVYRQEMTNGWVFALLPHESGWQIRLFHRDGGADLSASNPPLSAAVPNSRDIFGWHFRNADNSGPNDGSVNAPQLLRLFEFSPALVAEGASGEAQPPNTGRGWLLIKEMGLTRLEQGQRARMNYLAFEACITWPREFDAANDTTGDDPQYVAEEVEIMGKCGLDLARWTLHAQVLPRYLGGDFDGDGSLDDVVQVAAGEHRDLALCRAGTWLHLLRQADASAVFQHAVQAMEQWRVVDGKFADPGAPGGDAVWPQADGDVLVIERLEKSMHLIYMQDGELGVTTVYRYVEP